MCGIIGVIAPQGFTPPDFQSLYGVIIKSTERGTDSVGFCALVGGERYESRMPSRYSDTLLLPHQMNDTKKPIVFLGNVRAEPTTEWVKEKSDSDVQPYKDSNWTIVHNGTIANDKELEAEGYHKTLGTVIDSAIIPSVLGSPAIGPLTLRRFQRGLSKLKGSYATIAMPNDGTHRIFVGCNYKPIYVVRGAKGAMWFASQPQYITHVSHDIGVEPFKLAPYSVYSLEVKNRKIEVRKLLRSLYPERKEIFARALVVASGGLDSTVAAAETVKEFGRENTTLLHFTYGCRAQHRERQAIMDINAALQLTDVPRFLDVEALFKSIAFTSSLINRKAKLAGPIEGSEYAYEWVPARNLIFLSLATAIAENEDFSYIVLGNNLEESGAYPDNEPEFVHLFNNVLPLAVNEGKRLEVTMPVGNMMKHEIVKRGLEIGAPLAYTWSCYEGGDKHCGKCGPCFMRRTAFLMSGQQDRVQYAGDA